MGFGEALEALIEGKRIRNLKMDEYVSFALEDDQLFIFSDYLAYDGDFIKNELNKYDYDFYLKDLLSEDWEVVE